MEENNIDEKIIGALKHSGQITHDAIAFTRKIYTKNEEAYLINADGSGLHQIADGGVKGWSSDSTKVILTKDNLVKFYDVIKRKEELVCENDSLIGHTALSPNLNVLALEMSNYELKLLHLDSKQKATIIPGNLSFPKFSPDSNLLFYVLYDSYYIYNLKTEKHTNFSNLIKRKEPFMYFQFWVDSNTILTEVEKKDSCGSPSAGLIILLSTDGYTKKRITSIPQHTHYSFISPNIRYVLASHAPYNTQFIYDIKTGSKIDLQEPLNSSSIWLSWNPSSDSFVASKGNDLSKDNKLKDSIYLSNLTGKTRLLVKNGRYAYWRPNPNVK